MHYLYVLQRKNDELYIGYTNDLQRRFKEHQEEGRCKLLYYEVYLSEKLARDREKRLKYYGSAWRALKKELWLRGRGAHPVHMFFKSPPFGLDMSDYSIEIVSLDGNIKNPKLLAMAGAVLQPGVFENGKILEKENLENCLKNLIGNPKFGKIKTNKIIFSLPESKTYTHVFGLPENIKQSEILEFVRSQAKENFPLSLEELYFDFQIEKEKVLLIASPRKIVDDYLEIFRDCNLAPLALEVESLSLARSLIPLIPKNGNAVFIVDIGAEYTNLNIFEEGGMSFSFSLPVAGNKFTQAISEKLNIPKDAAEKLKKEAGLDSAFEEGRIFLILQKEIQPILAEIRRIQNYFQEKTGRSVEKMILTGGSGSLPRLLDYLQQNLGLPVEIGDPWVRINIDILKKKEYLREALGIEPILYSTVIGAALRGLERNPQGAGINLLPVKPGSRIWTNVL